MKKKIYQNIAIVSAIYLTLYLFIGLAQSSYGSNNVSDTGVDSAVYIKDTTICIKPKLENMDSLFEEAVKLIKEHEGWHSAKHYPYVGYGHKLLKGDNFDHNISESFATELVRKDLRQKMSVFRKYGRDSLILGVLAYNIGEYNIKGGYGHKKSTLLKKIESGDRDVFEDYTAHCRWKGKEIKSIRNRRIKEYNLLFNK